MGYHILCLYGQAILVVPCKRGSIGTGGGADIYMAKEYAKDFYNSQAWKDCRNAYVKYRAGLCERCYAKGIYSAGEIVHHKVHLTPDNINDTNVTLSFDNLQLLCRECHAEVHGKQKRYRFDTDGHCLISPNA